MTYAKYFKDDKFRESFLGTAVLRHHGGWCLSAVEGELNILGFILKNTQG
jgi:hypothetical protein